jgi:hypothetical protein
VAVAVHTHFFSYETKLIADEPEGNIVRRRSISNEETKGVKDAILMEDVN